MKKIMITLITLNFIISCSLKSKKKEELIPLKLNNSWVYLEKVIKKNKIIKIDTLTSSVNIVVLLNNKKWFHMTELGSEYIVRNDEQGQYEIDTLETLKNGDFKEILIVKNPNKKGETVYNAFDNTITIENDKTNIKTGIGEFECLKYKLITSEGKKGDYIEFYIKPGIGLIYHKWIQKDKTIISELIKYNLQ